MSSATAPGKIILFGEHAVVYGYPALAIPVLQVGVTVSIEVNPPDASTKLHITKTSGWKDRITITAPAIGRFGTLASFPSSHRPDPIALVIENVLNTIEIADPPPLDIHITSTIPVASGLGSGASVSVALVRAIAATLGKKITDEQVNLIAYEAEKVHHGTPSGLDNTVITYARPVYFIKDTPIQTFSVGAPFTLVIADSGVSAATRRSVGDVRKLWLADSNRVETIFSSIAYIVDQAHKFIQNGEWPALGPLLDQNHQLLQQLTVSSPILDRLTTAALASGALGAKLSGGGRGGNMIALVSPEIASSVADALRSAGARQTIIATVI